MARTFLLVPPEPTSGGGGGFGFGIFQTDSGTYPSATAPDDTATFTTWNLDIAEFVGDEITDLVTLNFKSQVQSQFFASPVGSSGKPVMREITAQDLPTNPPNVFAGYDNDGFLAYIPGWNFDSVNYSAHVNLSAVPVADGGSPNYTSLTYFNQNINPAFSTVKQAFAMFQVSTVYDPDNTDFNLGDVTNLGGINVSSTSFNTQSKGNIGYLNGSTVSVNLGGRSGGRLFGADMFGLNGSVESGYRVDFYNCFTAGVTFQVGSIINGTNTFGCFNQYRGTLTSGTSTFYTNNSYQITNVLADAIYGFTDGNNFNSGSYGGYATLNAFPSFGATTVLTGDFYGANLSPNFTSGFSSTQRLIGFQFNPGGSSSFDGGAMGLSINLGNVSIPSSFNFGIKTGAQIQSGTFSASIEHTMPDTASGFISYHSIGGVMTIASGHPVTGTALIANNFAFALNAVDDMGPDGSGLGIGFASVGFVSQLDVATGKTVDAVNFCLSGASASGPGAGTVNRLIVFNGLGFLPGSSVTVLEQIAFHSGTFLSASATTAWGVMIEDTGAHNWFAGDVVVGGSTGLPTSGYKLDVTGKGIMDSIDVTTSGVNYGTYTPTLTSVANVSASTAYACQWIKLGKTVTVSGKVSIDPTLALSTSLGISLPISSNFAAEENCGGTAAAPGIAGLSAGIKADATNDRAQLQYTAVDVTNQDFFFSFTYQVI